MAFMYLKLWQDREHGIRAEIVNSGQLGFSSLGGPNSKLSDQPFAVFEIGEFSGLRAIEEDDLLEELLRRMTPEQLAERVGYRFTAEDHLAALARLIGRRQ